MADLEVKGVAPKKKDKKNYQAGINLIIKSIENELKDNTKDLSAEQQEQQWHDAVTLSFEPFLLNQSLGSNVAGQHYDNLVDHVDFTYLRNINVAAREAKISVTVDLEKLFSNAPGRAFIKQQFVNINVSLIKSIPAQLHNQVQNVITDNFAQGFDREKLTNDIAGRFDVSTSRAKLIANDQTNKAIGQLVQLRSMSLGGATYEWVTSEDDAVRPTHAVLDGTIQRWDTPPPITGHPGQDINCRCIARTIINTDFLTLPMAA